MSEQKYPEWIDEYAKATYNAFMNMIPSSWEIIDYATFFPALDGTFIKKLAEAVRIVKEKNIPMEEVIKSMPNVSTLRCSLFWMFIENQGASKEDLKKKDAREVFDFLIDVLKNMAKEDIFCLNRNIAHSKEEISEVLKNTNWNDGSPEVARELGKLYSSLAAWAFSLYRDFWPQEANEIYGPYDASEKFGDGSILLIKNFAKIKPVELWSDTEKIKHKEVKILQVYKNVKFKCELIGMHSIYDGNLRDNLIAYEVLVDGKPVNNIEEIKKLSEYFAQEATKQMDVYKNMTKEDIIQKCLEWTCYQYVNFFKLAGMDWKPTQEMIDAVKGKDIGDKTVIEEFPPYEVYANDKEFEVYWLKDLYA